GPTQSAAVARQHPVARRPRHRVVRRSVAALVSQLARTQRTVREWTLTAASRRRPSRVRRTRRTRLDLGGVLAAGRGRHHRALGAGGAGIPGGRAALVVGVRRATGLALASRRAG